MPHFSFLENLHCLSCVLVNYLEHYLLWHWIFYVFYHVCLFFTSQSSPVLIFVTLLGRAICSISLEIWPLYLTSFGCCRYLTSLEGHILSKAFTLAFTLHFDYLEDITERIISFSFTCWFLAFRFQRVHKWVWHIGFLHSDFRVYISGCDTFQCILKKNFDIVLD